MLSEEMLCPECEITMNHHADKPDRSADLTEIKDTDFDMAGIIEIYTCPNCGQIEIRKTSLK